MRFLMLVSAAGRRLTPHTWATESAFVEHLRQLKKLLEPRYTQFVLAMPEMSAAQYEAARASCTVVDESVDGIRYEPTYLTTWSNWEFARHTPGILLRMRRLVREADLVHGGLSANVYRPVELMATLLGAAMDKKIISVTDMDNRRTAQMSYRLGMTSKKEYLKRTWVFDPLFDLQQRLYVKICDQVLFKETQQVEDYGAGAPHVRLFLDPNYAPEHIASDDVIERKVRALEDASTPLRVLYFGRFVEYKGVARMIEAVARARQLGAKLTLDLMGSGPQESALRALVKSKGIDDISTFIPPAPYGDAFFDTVRARDLMLACPLGADTPRSVWDSLASGVPVLAFDSPFYRSIATLTNAVLTTPWPEVEPFATALARLAADKTQLVPLARRGVAAARENTGDTWLKRRVLWMDELFSPSAPPRR